MFLVDVVLANLITVATLHMLPLWFYDKTQNDYYDKTIMASSLSSTLANSNFIHLHKLIPKSLFSIHIIQKCRIFVQNNDTVMHILQQMFVLLLDLQLIGKAN